MKRIPITIVVAVALALCAAGPWAAEPQRLKGEFVWDQRDKAGDLEAVFTPTGEQKWDVAFHFNFRDENHVYSGTAEGGLTEGQLKGTVFNEKQTRTFVFKGTFDGGTFNGTHAELEDGAEQATGTLKLRAPEPAPAPAPAPAAR